MAGDIDFKEIEKAMAELVNKSQSQVRKKQLTKVVKKRDEIAKKVDNSREQGRMATKRIIIGNKNLRSSVVSAEQPATSVTARVSRPNPTAVITDFRTTTPNVPKPFIAPSTPAKEAPVNDEVAEPENLSKTIGDLSDDFLKEEVSESNIDPTLAEEGLAEPEFSSPEPIVESPQSAPSVPEAITTPPPAPEALSEAQEIPEQLEGYAQSPGPIAEAEPSVAPSPADELDSPIYNPNSGAVHRMYGQRMKTPVVQASNRVGNKDSNLSSPKKEKHKKGFLFYFVLLLTLAALGIWGYVGYIFFVPKS